MFKLNHANTKPAHKNYENVIYYIFQHFSFARIIKEMFEYLPVHNNAKLING